MKKTALLLTLLSACLSPVDPSSLDAGPDAAVEPAVVLKPPLLGSHTCSAWSAADESAQTCVRTCCDVYLSGLVDCYTQRDINSHNLCWPWP